MRRAVLCSLRASASQVLTQQTMGRGLRLPFGVVTGYPLIDQLDIISHKAFESALKDEGVLKSFGLEETVREAGQRPTIKPGIGEDTSTSEARDGEDHAHGGTESYGQPEGGSRDTRADSDVGGSTTAGAGAAGRPGGMSGNTSGVGMYELDLFGYEDTDTEPAEPVTYMVNTAFEETTFTFPASRLVVGEPLEFSPAQISTDVLQQKARTVSDSGETIERHRLTIPNPKLRRIIAQRTKDATTASEAISREDARDVIITGLRKSSKVPRTSSKSWLKLVEGRVEVFMDAVVVDWTVNSAASAADIFTEVYVSALREHAKRSQVTRTQVVPVTVPVYQTIVVPAGVEVLPRSDDARGFLSGQPYGLYEQSIFPIASFDAYSTEYRIAELLEAAPDVTWWKRLDQSRDRDAHISVTPTNLYFPDFIIYEEETDTYYIIEGKRSDEVDSAAVQEKAAATRKVFAYLPQHDEFTGQAWKYLLISEKDIVQAGSWTGLKFHAKS